MRAFWRVSADSMRQSIGERLLRKLAKSVEYQYILDLNYTRFTFSEN